MKLQGIFLLALILVNLSSYGQENQNGSLKDAYIAEQKKIGNSFASHFYPNYFKINSLNEKEFVSKIDSARNLFDNLLQQNAASLDAEFVKAQKTEIKYYFDKILLDYPNAHDTYLQSEKETIPSTELSRRLEANLTDFNKPELLSNADVLEYVRAWFHHAINKELKTAKYKNTDNQSLQAVWKLIPQTISNETCREFWQTEYLFEHIENSGIKNIEPIVRNFNASVKNKSSLEKVRAIYSEDSLGRQGHVTKVYKSVSGVTLDLHLFLPDASQYPGKHPTYVYFHGGSWTEGKPDWGFPGCESYAKKGWVGVAVEYRTSGRHNTLPFESVMDAKSAIRWLRKNAILFNIDTARIVAAGNSAGAHLVLTTALATKWNEKTDDLKFSPTPNILLVNSAAYDLTADNSRWITKDLKNKEVVKEISPMHLDKRNMPPTLILHGTNDQNCSFSEAEKFKNEAGPLNKNLEFHALEGAGHFIWFDPKCVDQISKWRTDFLAKFGIE